MGRLGSGPRCGPDGLLRGFLTQLLLFAFGRENVNFNGMVGTYQAQNLDKT